VAIGDNELKIIVKWINREAQQARGQWPRPKFNQIVAFK
jgi:hypothetical protein